MLIRKASDELDHLCDFKGFDTTWHLPYELRVAWHRAEALSVVGRFKMYQIRRDRSKPCS